MAYTTTTPTPGFSKDDPVCKYDRVFPDGEAVGKVLTADEVRYLFSAYQLAQAKYGPNETICLPEDINLWVRRLVEGAAENPFLRLSSHQWAELLTMLARRLYGLSSFLEAQWESLPDSLKSELQMFCLGTGSSGEPADSISTALPEGEISFEQAVRFANQQLGRDDTTE